MECLSRQENLLLFLQSVNERLPCLIQGEAIFPVHDVKMGIFLSGFPDDAVPASVLYGQDTSVTWCGYEV